jgi:uncharacterized repeat protein (TIGR01451 family)
VRRYLALAAMAALAMLFGALPAPALAVSDLAVTMTASQNPVPVGQTVTFTITVANNGPEPATSTTLTDTLSADVDFVSAETTQPGATCNEGAPGVVCDLGTIENGASAEVRVTVRTKILGSFDNTAQAGSVGTNPNPADDQVTLATSVAPAADLNVVTTTSENPVSAGGTLTYTITITNSGPSPATSVSLTDTLPEGATLDGAPTVSDGGTCSNTVNEVSCELINLAEGATATVTIAVKAPGAGPLVNIAAATALELDPDLADNQTTTTVAVTPVADVSVTAAGSAPVVNSGSELTYSLVVRNDGPSAATNVTVVNTLPAGVALLGLTPSQGTCSITGTEVTCPLGTLASTATATVLIRVQAVTPGAITDAVTASAAELDPSIANNSASVATTVNVASDLTLTAQGPAAPVPAGGPVDYRFVVTNTGPSLATGVVFTDTLPAGVTASAAVPTQGACAPAGPALSCSLGSIPAGTAVTITVTATASVPGPIVQAVSVRGAEPDPNLANNDTSLATEIANGANLVLTQRGARTRAAIGDEIRYVLRVVNRGPSAATGVRVVNKIGKRFILGSALPSRGRCTVRAKTVTCALGGLTSGQSARVTIILIPLAAGPLTNTVTAASASPADGNPNNNQVVVRTRVSRTPAALAPPR